MARISSLRVVAVAASVFFAGAAVGAQESADVGARVQRILASSGTSAGGGPFSLETRSADLLEPASTGGAFRLVPSTNLKAVGDVFSDDFESGDTANWSKMVPDHELPSGAVVAFEMEACPSGWTEATTFNRGRALVGLVPGGTRGVSNWVGEWDGDRDTHGHPSELALTTDGRSHNHQWSLLVSGSWVRWRTFNAAGGNVYLDYDIDGFGAQSDGHYPLAANPTVDLFTTNRSHSHSVTVDHLITAEDLDPAPNVQLRLCRKD